MRSTGLHIVNETQMSPYCQWKAQVSILSWRSKYLPILSWRSKYLPILSMTRKKISLLSYEKHMSPYCHQLWIYLFTTFLFTNLFAVLWEAIIFNLFIPLKESCVVFFIFIHMLIEHSVSIKWRPWSNPVFRGSRSAMFAYVTQRGRKAYMG